jgi:hypothetical protein
MPRFFKNQTCRAIEMEGTLEELQRHFDLKMEFLERGIVSPQGGASGPVKGKPGRYFVVGYIDESVADEYVRRMRARTQKAFEAGRPAPQQ